MEPKPNPFLVASLMNGVGDQTHIQFTLATAVVGALVIFRNRLPVWPMVRLDVATAANQARSQGGSEAQGASISRGVG
jgi:hypothetical protein